jgi:hypothetical protein
VDTPCYQMAGCYGGLVYALIGGLLGGSLGEVLARNRWERVPTNRLRVGVAPLPSGRLGLGAAIDF